MADNITAGVAKVFVEDVAVQSNAGGDAYIWSRDEAFQWVDEQVDNEQSPQSHHEGYSGEDVKGKGPANSGEEGQDSDSSDEDYDKPLDEDSSAEDEER